MNTLKSGVMALLGSILLLGLLGSSVTWAASCLDNGCHPDQVDWKYLHGPLAAESAGAPGCQSCHVSTGAPCTGAKAGKFKFLAAKDGLCTSCHEKSTSTQHLERTTAECLDCHDPHGSDDDMNMLR